MIQKLTFFLLFLALGTSAKTICPKGFALINGNKCLNIFSDHYKHRDAETKCSEFGGTLVTVHNAIDNTAVANFAGAAVAQYTWLGIFCFGNDTTQCYSDDGSGALGYSNFVPGHPKIDGGLGGCVYMQTYGPAKGKWYSGPCDVTRLAFVCEAPSTVEDPTCTYNYNGNCYYPSFGMKYSTNLNATFSDAEYLCNYFYQSPLVSIHSRMELDFIRSIFKNNLRGGFNKAFIGAKPSANGDWEWTDNSKMNYQNMDPVNEKPGKCLVMDLTADRADNGMWSRMDCTKDTIFACKKKIEVPASVEMEVNPKFKAGTPAREKKAQNLINLADMSHCNSTLFLAPGVVTSFDYPSKQAPPTFCTWRIAVLGAYRLGIYFTDFSLGDTLKVYDEFGNILDDPHGTRAPYGKLAPTNIITMTHDASYDAQWSYHGFSATILPYV
ncbi:hypothetical protein B9Z55_008111 [Caenorhabditis nigoni]|uniref:C-type lectin domain-containing protein n=1 Tax=Caenorhabditis nigoni TaxID=1611254 RepID=A0A2G5VCP4_9PELO|nr:hypothetical protein B9Z55_008111 [Caenorhabditis nigoni]